MYKKWLTGEGLNWTLTLEFTILRSQKRKKRVKMQIGKEAFLPKNCNNHCSIQT